MKSISVTVGILILTVFLSLSAPAYAAPLPPYTVYDCVMEYTDGTADGELVTIYKAGDPLNNITVALGSSLGPGCWKVHDLRDMPGSVIDGDTIVVEILGKSTTFVLDTSTGGRRASSIPPVTNNGGDDTGDSSSSGGGGRDGTYPPEPAPTPATPEPTAAEPTVAPAEAPTEAPAKAPTKAPTVVATKTTTELKTEGTPGFGAVVTVFAIAGLLVATYLVMRRRE